MGGIIEYSYLLGFLLALIAIFDFLINLGLKGKTLFFTFLVDSPVYKCL